MSKLKDLTGKRFGMLVVIEQDKSRILPSGQHKTYWKCKCDCGNDCSVSATNLQSGHTVSCGCWQKMTRLGHIKDLTGQKFGRLLVVERAKDKYYNGVRCTTWVCKCDCGNTTIVSTSSLTTGNTTSCGCYALELRSVRHKTHGMSKSRLYNIWNGILTRCYNEHSTKYKNYGARGITVCDEWHKFENFYEWAKETGYDENAKYGECTIEREDVNGNYCPTNCKWATSKEQANNTTTNRLITWNNETKTASQWEEIVGIKASIIRDRLQNGWSTEKALTTPPRCRNKQTEK